MGSGTQCCVGHDEAVASLHWAVTRRTFGAKSSDRLWLPPAYAVKCTHRSRFFPDGNSRTDTHHGTTGYLKDMGTTIGLLFLLDMLSWLL